MYICSIDLRTFLYATDLSLIKDKKDFFLNKFCPGLKFMLFDRAF
jgi:hypothetical protein